MQILSIPKSCFLAILVAGQLLLGDSFHNPRIIQQPAPSLLSTTPFSGNLNVERNLHVVSALKPRRFMVLDDRQVEDEVRMEETIEVSSEYIPVDGDFDGAKFHLEYDFDYYFQIMIPIISPILAYISYEPLAEAFSFVVDALSSNNWIAVDGGAYQARIIAPAVNGVVVPAIAVLFATLTSTTISTLRQRQVDVRLAINMEAGELRVLECLLESFPAGRAREQCRNYLIQYTTRLISECNPRHGSGSDIVNPRRSMDSELTGIVRQLSESYDCIPPHVASEALASIARLREQRQKRITALQSTYPSLHYIILFILAIAECIAFMIETNQELLFFLNAIQLKLLWSMLVSTFVACFSVFYDLRAPFSGNYQVTASVEQLFTIRSALKAGEKIEDSMQKNSY